MDQIAKTIQKVPDAPDAPDAVSSATVLGFVATQLYYYLSSFLWLTISLIVSISLT